VIFSELHYFRFRFLALLKKGCTLGVVGKVLRRGENFGLGFGCVMKIVEFPAVGIGGPGGATGDGFGRLFP